MAATFRRWLGGTMRTLKQVVGLWHVRPARAVASREQFDALSGAHGSFLVVAALGGIALVLGGFVERAVASCGPGNLSFLQLELTFDAREFAEMLNPLKDACQRGVLWSLVVDGAFALGYGLALSALYLWVERYLRFGPREKPCPPADLPPLSAVVVVLPFIAATLDLVFENLALLVAAWPLWRPDGAIMASGLTSALVMIGSIGAALKWTALAAYGLGLLCTLFIGERGTVLWQARFSVVAALLGSVPLLVVPQGQDIARRLTEGPYAAWRAVVGVAALVMCAIGVWYSARILGLLRQRIEREKAEAEAKAASPATRTEDDPEDSWLLFFEEHIPRMLAVGLLVIAGLAFARVADAEEWFLGVAVGTYLVSMVLARPKRGKLLEAWGAFVLPRTLAEDGRLDAFRQRIGRVMIGVVGAALLLAWRPAPWPQRLASALLVASAWLLYLYIYSRRELRARDRDSDTTKQALRTGITDTQRTRVRSQLIAFGLVSAGLLLAFTFQSVTVGRALGGLPILALMATHAVVVGGMLVHLGRRTGLPMVGLLVGMAVAFSWWNDNHDIRPLPDAEAARHEVRSLQAHFNGWLARRAAEQEGPVPVVLVAASGGGLRAAYWSALALAELQDRDSTFARHVYAMSGVSGGSLGTGLFAAMVRDRAGQANAPCAPMTACVRDFMDDDFLAPVLGKMVAPDMLQWFLPCPIGAFDRATALEESWERSYRDVFGTTTLEEPFLQLYADSARSRDVPVLLLNTTHVQTGKRYISSPVDDPGVFLDARSVWEAMGRDLRLSTAIHNSARFTLVSPAGRIDRGDGQSYGSLVDGGYFENSGLTAVADLHAMLRARAVQGSLPPLDVSVLYLCNDPVSCAADMATERPLTSKRGAVGELLSPPTALMATRDARGSYARGRVTHQVHDASLPMHYFQLNVCDGLAVTQSDEADQHLRDRLVDPPLGWLLSTGAMAWMDNSLVRPRAAGGGGASCRQANADVLDQLLARVSAGRR